MNTSQYIPDGKGNMVLVERAKYPFFALSEGASGVLTIVPCVTREQAERLALTFSPVGYVCPREAVAKTLNMRLN